MPSAQIKPRFSAALLVLLLIGSMTIHAQDLPYAVLPGDSK